MKEDMKLSQSSGCERIARKSCARTRSRSCVAPAATNSSCRRPCPYSVKTRIKASSLEKEDPTLKK